jgi:hypothetical protein
MPESDPLFYERAIRRISWLTVGLGLLGSIVTVSLRGFWSGLAFLVGAAVSYFSFFGWRRLAGAIGPGGQTRFAWLFVARNFVLLAAAWVIIKFLGPNAMAGATGLFVATAAIILEIIYELIYAS